MIKKSSFLILAVLLCALLVVGCAQNRTTPLSNSPTNAVPSESTPPQSGNPGSSINYPTKGVTVIVPDKAGGSSDLLARLTFSEVEKKLNQSFSVVNKEGSGGQLGLIDVADAAPDGYTIGSLTDFATASTHATSDDVGYKIEDLDFVCSITAGTNIIVLGADFPGEKTVEGLINYAKENPGKLTMGVAASGQSMVLSSLMEEAQVKITEVMFNSGNETYTNLIGGHIDAAILGTKFFTQSAEQGCTSIAVTSHTRFSLLPEIPTLLESGYNVLNNEVSRVFVVPAGTPKEIIDLLANTIHEATDNDEFKSVMEKNNEMYLFRNAEESLAIYNQKLEQLKELIK